MSVLSLLVGTAVTLIVYRLSRKLDFRTRIHTWGELRDVTRRFAAEMHDQGLNKEVILLNADRYEKDYDGGNRFTRHGYIQVRTEFIDVRHDGLALMTFPVSTWRDASGRRVLDEADTQDENVLEVGFVPFDWIEHIDPDGNDYKNAPLVYVHFRGPGRTPFKSYSYHEPNSVPMGPRDRPFYPSIPGLGIRRPTRTQAWSEFWRTWKSDIKMRKSERKARRQLGDASAR
ncbi:hypothetical protein LH407_01260 [Antiquaquibacter oligotrophicus]|uniref:hypothetical protein n=1 Tax=Antiquaquibacter oligotrophicus TaxID=2880260 RepID=UPI002AC94722|nr:hypothetical protein [Antiquaquibacter oligotrophicus]UDF13515.1 hypothetical protein LH407_01260 [Antiquaquibacter oligotrophicus]